MEITKEEYLRAKAIVNKYESDPSNIFEITHDVNPPSWLSDRLKSNVKELWNTPNVDNSNPRIKALQLVRSEANSHGYTIDIKKATDIIREFCI